MQVLPLLLSAVLTLFLVMDPLGNVPLFASHLKDVRERRKTWVVARESFIALAVLLICLFFGPLLMDLMHIGQESLHIAGGVLLLLIALGMIFPGGNPLTADDELPHSEPFIVPLAIPLIAGPSTMATVMLFSSQPKRFPLWVVFLALVAAWLLSSAILLLSTTFSRVLGQRGLVACERLMGMVLSVVSVQMLLDGIELFVKPFLGKR